MIREVWGNRTVSDDAINRCVSILRTLLSPSDKNAYIETVVRRGFISHFPDAPDDVQPPAKRSRRLSAVVFTALALAIFVVVYFATRDFSVPSPEILETPGDGLPMVAVLPFDYSGFEEDGEFFANGILDDLLTQLAQLESMRVISRTSVQDYRGTQLNIREIGRELGADAILEGSIQAVDQQIRINMQLIDARTDAHLWAQRYDRELLPANIFAVQSEIARAVSTAMHATLTTQDAEQLAILPTNNMAAYRAYHRAMEIRDTQGVDAPGYIAALEESVTLDTEFVRAWAELAGYLSFQNFSIQEDESILRIERILEHIQDLAPDSADYLIAQSYYTYYVLRDYEKALQLILRAQSLKPSDVRVLELKSNIQRRLGDFSGKIESTRQARTLDPRNRVWTAIIVNNLMLAHRYEEARREIENAPFRSLGLASHQSFLEIGNLQDIRQRPGVLMALQAEYETQTHPYDLWDAHIAAREYEMAAQYLDVLKTTGLDIYFPTVTGISQISSNAIISYWFTQDGNRLNPLLTQARTSLEERRDEDGEYLHRNQYLALAVVTAAEGDKAETERLVRTWMRLAIDDLASLANIRHYACRVLGMAGSAAAVECIRTALIEPSRVAPFYEPYLPYYDSIREEPEFIGLLAEIGE